MDWRATFHLTGDRNWINDPNGLVYHDGRYHLFYQANPDAPVWGPPRWGHASSVDLCHWMRHPLALTPTPGGPDRDGCWSGCLRFVGGTPTIFYTGVTGADDEWIEAICVATGTSDLAVWTPAPAALVGSPPALLAHGYHRDPFVWRDDRGWHLLVGTGLATPTEHGAVGIYHSVDAHSWQWGGLFFDGPDRADGVILGRHWECPQLAFVDGSWMLMVSASDPSSPRRLLHTVAFIGDIDAGFRFAASNVSVLDAGDRYYAGTIGWDADGQLVTVGWVQEGVPADVQSGLPKAGAISLPRRLGVRQGRAVATAHPALDHLPRPIIPDADGRPSAVGAAFRVQLTADDRQPTELTLTADQTTDALVVRVEPASRRVEVEIRDGFGRRHLRSEMWAGLPSAAEVVVYGDGSLVEVFVDGAAPITTRWYRAQPDCRLGIRPRDRAAGAVVSAIAPTIGDAGRP